ncbi:ROK family protein [Vibrio tasmaniensis]|uniref:ROK family protein n=1 Tax=Vibrio tasmaniensis TaxID=212663 RepID=UPI001FE42410|nr:ROK family protein [Vibrio tasmaniensis]
MLIKAEPNIVMGIAIDSHSIYSVASTSNGQEVYRMVQRIPGDLAHLTQHLISRISSVSYRYGSIAAIGISTSEFFSSHRQSVNNLTKQSQTHSPELAQLAMNLIQHFKVDCSLVMHSHSAAIACDAISNATTNADLIEQPLSADSSLNKRAIGLQKEATLSVFLGDGCGMSFYKNNEQEHHPLSSHWAHSTLPNFQWLVDGLTPICRCGNEACIEQFLSAPSIERQYHQVVLKDQTLTQIFSGVDQSEPHASRIYRTYIDQLARSLVNPIQQLQPTRLVLSGEATTYPTLTADLKVALSRYIHVNEIPVIIHPKQDEFTFARGAFLIAEKNHNNHLRSS